MTDRETQKLLAVVDAIAAKRKQSFVDCLAWIVETKEGKRAFEKEERKAA